MKTKFGLFIVFFSLAFTFSSCSNNDDDPVNVTEGDIAGVWNIVDLQQQATVTTTANGQTITATNSTVGSNYNMTYNFSTNPNTVEANGTIIGIVTATVDGQSTTEEVPIEAFGDINNGTWSLNGSTITISDGVTSIDATVQEYSISRMVLFYQFDITTDLLGVTFSTVGSSTIILER